MRGSCSIPRACKSWTCCRGHWTKVDSIETRFPGALGTTTQSLNRLAIVYDTRDDLTVPSRGLQLIAYGGLASRGGLFNDSMYSEVGADGRSFLTVAKDTVVVTHMAMRYLPTAHDVPFWALSSIGGGDSVVGGTQPLRGFGLGRYYDRDSFSTSVEVRRKVFSFDATSTLVDIEVTPFIDVGRVLHTAARIPCLICTTSMASDFAASRAPLWSGTWTSATAARASPRSPGSTIRFDGRSGGAEAANAFAGIAQVIVQVVANESSRVAHILG
jgi:outer membrane protein assembly factor BamA